MQDALIATVAADAPPKSKPSNYPEPFAARMAARTKRPLGDVFGLKNFGVNLTRLKPGGSSALHHRHLRQDEFVYILEGMPTLFVGEKSVQLRPGMVAGFAAGGCAHHLENQTDQDCVFLEVGDRTTGDAVSYPVDDIQAILGADGKWRFVHKDGRPYSSQTQK